MTPTNTSTEAPTSSSTTTGSRDTRTGSPSTRKAERPRSPRRFAGWVVWACIALALVAAITLAMAGVSGDDPDGPVPGYVDQAGSDVHLGNLADDIADHQATLPGSDQHLRNLAADGGRS